MASISPPPAFGFQWHVTSRCPNGCMHCYQADNNIYDDLPVSELKAIADVIMSSVPAPVAVNLTGGEPFLYRGIFELMEHLSTFDGLGEMNIITSTVGLDDGIINDLAMIPKLSYVKVSLESDDPQINDTIRGNGHYHTTVQNVNRLIGAGLRVIFMATLSKRNVGSIKGLCGLAGDLGVSGVIFERFVPLGRGASGMAESVLAPSDWSDILASIADITGVSIDDLRPYKAFWVDGEDVSGAPCCLGSSSMALMPDGTVYPCRRVPKPVGKLPGDGMETIIASLNQYATTPQRCFDFGE